MKTKTCIYATLCLLFVSQMAHGWGRHDLLTKYALKDIKWINQYTSIKVSSFETYLKKSFSKSFTKKDFLNQYQLNPNTKIKFSTNAITSARQILINYADEPDWGMDEGLNLYPYQKYMGGTKGPTSKAFRHMYFKKWSIKAPLRTFHFPPREMGEALKRAQIFYILAEDAFKVKEPYWAFRFLAWSLHYIQDLGQPFHTSQLLTPNFVAFHDLFPFSKCVKRTTQIIGNYHFLYEYYIVHRMLKDKNPKTNELIKALIDDKIHHSSSALLIAKHASDFSNRYSSEMGEAAFRFFGKKFLDPGIDVPNSPRSKFNMSEFDKDSNLKEAEKKQFLKSTAKTLVKTGIYTRSLLELAREEILRPSGSE